MSRVTHFELSAEDPKRAMKFYEETFGWKFQRWGEQEYWLASTGDAKGLGINGAIRPKGSDIPLVVNTIGVGDLDESIKRIEKNGGKVITDKMETPNIGVMVYFTDTEGITHGLIQPSMNGQI
jgi:predicted enzyme related to lactoylglutathione lyase